jgi:hypothetical protein
MAIYLFTWVPEYYKELYEDYKKWLGEGRVDVPNWSSGSSKSIPTEVSVFVMRQGSEPRGIIARGRTISPTRTPGESGNAHANDLRLDEMSNPDDPLISVEQLLTIRGKRGLWDARGGGITIPADAAEKLETAWHEAWKNRTAHG